MVSDLESDNVFLSDSKEKNKMLGFFLYNASTVSKSSVWFQYDLYHYILLQK